MKWIWMSLIWIAGDAVQETDYVRINIKSVAFFIYAEFLLINLKKLVTKSPCNFTPLRSVRNAQDLGKKMITKLVKKKKVLIRSSIQLPEW